MAAYNNSNRINGAYYKGQNVNGKMPFNRLIFVPNTEVRVKYVSTLTGNKIAERDFKVEYDKGVTLSEFNLPYLHSGYYFPYYTDQQYKAASDQPLGITNIQTGDHKVAITYTLSPVKLYGTIYIHYNYKGTSYGTEKATNIIGTPFNSMYVTGKEPYLARISCTIDSVDNEDIKFDYRPQTVYVNLLPMYTTITINYINRQLPDKYLGTQYSTSVTRRVGTPFDIAPYVDNLPNPNWTDGQPDKDSLSVTNFEWGGFQNVNIYFNPPHIKLTIIYRDNVNNITVLKNKIKGYEGNVINYDYNKLPNGYTANGTPENECSAFPDHNENVVIPIMPSDTLNNQYNTASTAASLFNSQSASLSNYLSASNSAMSASISASASASESIENSAIDSLSAYNSLATKHNEEGFAEIEAPYKSLLDKEAKRSEKTSKKASKALKQAEVARQTSPPAWYRTKGNPNIFY